MKILLLTLLMTQSACGLFKSKQHTKFVMKGNKSYGYEILRGPKNNELLMAIFTGNRKTSEEMSLRYSLLSAYKFCSEKNLFLHVMKAYTDSKNDSEVTSGVTDFFCKNKKHAQSEKNFLVACEGLDERDRPEICAIEN